MKAMNLASRTDWLCALPTKSKTREGKKKKSPSLQLSNVEQATIQINYLIHTISNNAMILNSDIKASWMTWLPSLASCFQIRNWSLTSRSMSSATLPTGGDKRLKLTMALNLQGSNCLHFKRGWVKVTKLSNPFNNFTEVSDYMFFLVLLIPSSTKILLLFAFNNQRRQGNNPHLKNFHPS